MFKYYKTNPEVVGKYLRKEIRASYRIKQFLPMFENDTLPDDYISRAVIAQIVSQHPGLFPLDEHSLAHHVSSLISSLKRMGLLVDVDALELPESSEDYVAAAHNQFLDWINTRAPKPEVKPEPEIVPKPKRRTKATAEPAKRKRGRPSKAELEARQLAAANA